MPWAFAREDYPDHNAEVEELADRPWGSDTDSGDPDSGMWNQSSGL